MDRSRLPVSKRGHCALVGGGAGAVHLGVLWLSGGFGDVVLTFVIFLPATVFGGLLASYLWDGGVRDGAIVGAYAGAVAILPGILLPLWLLAAAFSGSEGAGMALAYFLLTAILFVIGLVVAVVLGALGGVAWAVHASKPNRPAGVTETDCSRSPQREGPTDRDHEPANSSDQQGPSQGGTGSRDSGSHADRESRDSPGADGRADGSDDGVGRSTTDGGRSRWFSGTVGGLVGVVLLPVSIAFLPPASGVFLSVVLGGATAGVLQRGDVREGALTGAIAGAVTVSPIGLYLLVGLWENLDPFWLVALPLGVVTFVGLGSVGAALGTVASERLSRPEDGGPSDGPAAGSDGRDRDDER